MCDKNRELDSNMQVDNQNVQITELDTVRIKILENISEWIRITNSINDFSIHCTEAARCTDIREDVLDNLAYDLSGKVNAQYIKQILQFIINGSKYSVCSKGNIIPIIPKSLQDVLNGEKIDLPIIAGPCAIESEQQMQAVGKKLKKLGIKLLRGGAFKPRTSPYDFQGYGIEALEIIHATSKEFGLISVSEVVDTRSVEIMEKYVDILQIGARNMFNYELLKEVGKSQKPVILKRGLMSTIKEFLYAIEYIRLNGNENIVLCERGIRTFENFTRNTLDIASVPLLKKETGLPMAVDLSHSLGRKDLIEPLGKACLVAGADLLMVEAHPYPELALSDSKQQMNFSELQCLVNSLF